MDGKVAINNLLDPSGDRTAQNRQETERWKREEIGNELRKGRSERKRERRGGKALKGRREAREEPHFALLLVFATMNAIS